MWFSSKDEYWKWLETNNQTSENIIDKRFDLREIVSLTRESAQNSVDAFLHSTSDVDRNHASIKYKFFSSNEDLSTYRLSTQGFAETMKTLVAEINEANSLGDNILAEDMTSEYRTVEQNLSTYERDFMNSNPKSSISKSRDLLENWWRWLGTS